MNTVEEILINHGVRMTDSINFEIEARNRINYLKDYLRSSRKHGLVLGISGGVDSTTAGRLCQIACEELRKEKYSAIFYAVRLPYIKQADEEDAQLALDFISPDDIVTVNIEDSVDSIHHQISRHSGNTQQSLDFHKGNVKARMRMIAQYEIAGITDSLVVGTDHNSELVPAFYTKWGDQACDITVLDGLNKRQVQRLSEILCAPEKLYEKLPTADLEELRPGLLDEVALGFSYDDLDDFLEGIAIDQIVIDKICAQYEKTRHKRDWPISYTNK